LQTGDPKPFYFHACETSLNQYEDSRFKDKHNRFPFTLLVSKPRQAVRTLLQLQLQYLARQSRATHKGARGSWGTRNETVTLQRFIFETRPQPGKRAWRWVLVAAVSEALKACTHIMMLGTHSLLLLFGRADDSLLLMLHPASSTEPS
jgi:hypothetical protein